MAAKKHGFAAMDPDRRRELASMGGKAVQASGHARRWTSETARVAGSKGGLKRGEHMKADPAGDGA